MPRLTSGPDSRLPLRFGPVASRRPGEALLTDKPNPLGSPAPPGASIAPSVPRHLPGCACCTPRSAAAVALAGLFRTRALGEPFSAVLADLSPPGEAAVRAALEGDVLVAARFRLVP